MLARCEQLGGIHRMGVVGRKTTTEDMHVLIPGTCECYQNGHCVCDSAKDLEVGRWSWITRQGPL